MPDVASATVLLTAKDMATAGLSKLQKTMLAVQARFQAVSRVANWALLGIAGAIGISIRAALEQEHAIKRLETALIVTGQSVEVWSKYLQKAATNIQKLTSYGDEFIHTVMAQGIVLGVTVDRIEDFTQRAIGLARVLDMELPEAFRALMMAEQGEYKTLNMRLPLLKKINDVNEKQIYLNKIVATGWEMVKKEAHDTTGSMAQLKNELGELQEAVGFAFLPTMKELIDNTKEIVISFTKWADENRPLIMTMTKVSLVLLGIISVVPKLYMTIKGLIPVITALGVSLIWLGTMAKKIISEFIGFQLLIGGTAVTISAFTVLIIACIAALVALAIHTWKCKRAMQALSDSGKELGVLSKEYSNLRKELEKTYDPSKKIALLSQMIDKQKEMIANEEAMKQLTKEERVIRDIDARINKLKELISVNKNKIEQLKEEKKAYDEIKDKEKDAAKAKEELAKSITDLERKLKEEMETFGMDARQVEIYRLQMQGATDANLVFADALAKKIRQMEKAQEAADKMADAEAEATEMIKDAWFEVDKLKKGMSDAAIKVHEFIERWGANISPETLKRLQDGLFAAQDALEVEKERNDIAQDRLNIEKQSVQYVGLEELHKRIAASAATATEREKVSIEQARERGQRPEAPRPDNRPQEKQATMLEKIFNLLQDVKKGLPLVGAFGP